MAMDSTKLDFTLGKCDQTMVLLVSDQDSDVAVNFTRPLVSLHGQEVRCRRLVRSQQHLQKLQSQRVQMSVHCPNTTQPWKHDINTWSNLTRSTALPLDLRPASHCPFPLAGKTVEARFSYITGFVQVGKTPATDPDGFEANTLRILGDKFGFKIKFVRDDYGAPIPEGGGRWSGFTGLVQV